MAETKTPKENMEMVKSLMKKAGEINTGGSLKQGTKIEFTSDFGNEYTGYVEFKKPTMSDYLKIGGIKSELLRKAGVQNVNLVDNAVRLIAHVMATLQVVVTKSPEWLHDIEKVEESDLLYHVYGKFEVWENSFRKDAGTAEAGDSETT